MVQLIPSRSTRRGAKATDTQRKALLLLLNEHPLVRDRLIEYLHRIQDHHGYLPKAERLALAELLQISPAELNEVATFYHLFRTAPSQSPVLQLCASPSCQMAGSDELINQLRHNFGDRIEIGTCGCIGQCDQAPAGLLGQRVLTIIDVEQTEEAILDGTDKQEHPYSEPLSLYRQRGGYAAPSGETLLTQIEQAGLRGLGGAGFPVARKWRAVQAQPAPRALVVNLDEGEPGTFKDRYLLERQPHQILDGALLAAQTVDCDKIYLYLRDEYPLARRLLQHAIADLADSDLNPPPIELRRGAGAYICGEESALIESLEGKRGMPRQRPPFVAECGLFNQPTLVHNGETLWWVAEIARRGGSFFAQEGRRGRQGLRHFSVSGRVRKPGVYLAPVGISAEELIHEYAGGMAAGHQLYGYFPGGASGGMLPARLADLPLDFDTLHEHGCFIGSAALIVFSEADRARELALNAMQFFKHESCGQCTPCRVGTDRAQQLMQQSDWDIPTLKQLATLMQDTSICGLGQAAANPLLCALRYFPHEFPSQDPDPQESANG